MLIIQIAGGLGNQMQQYAMYRKLLKAGADKNVKLDTGWFDENNQSGVLAKRKLELSYFTNLPMKICTDEERAYFTDRSIARKVSRLLLLDRVIPTMRETYP